AGAVAGVAGELELHRHRRLHAAQRILERHAHLDLDIVPALPAALRLRTATAAVEETAEEISEIEVAEVERRPARPRTAADATVRRPEAVVLLSLLRVGEDVVGALHLLEALLVPRALVRVHLANELAVGLLDLVRSGVLGDAQDLVEAARQLPTPSRSPRVRAAARGRRACSPSGAPGPPCPPPARTAARAAPP